MLRSVRSQIVLGTSMVIVAVLAASAYLVISQKTKEISHDIFTNAVSFAELTHERIVTNYEKSYVPKAFANFDREMADIYRLNEDIPSISVFSYAGEALYRPESETLDKLTDEGMERVQAVVPSVRTTGGRVVYLDKTDEGIRYTDFNGRPVQSIGPIERIQDIVYPFRDPNNALRGFSVRYKVSYEALTSRVRETRNNILVLAVFGIVIALFIGGVVAEKITAPITTLAAGAAKIGTGDLTTRIAVASKTEIGRLAGTFNKMAADLEVSTKQLVEKEKLTRELELAGEIQKELLPKTLPTVKNLDVAASLASAEEVGGDCYDFIPVAEGNFIFYIGDVTGHGVPAGLVSAINNALVPAFLERYQTTSDLIIHLNRLLKMKTRPNVFMTMVMARWMAEQAALEFTQAGHDPILHFGSADGSVRELSTGGMALGMLPDVSAIVKTETVPMAVGDVAVLYTDGIPEAWKNETENYGMERFKESIVRNGRLPTAQQVHDALIREVRAYMGDYPQADDITLMVVKRTS